MAQPRVTVVVPTRNRPALLERALASLRAQTVSWWDAVVVVDGPDPETAAQLRAEGDPRIRFIVNERSLGGGEARNVGIRSATGAWIGLLDDDDEWLPERLERQFEALGGDAGRDDVIAFARMIVRTPRGDFVWPRRRPAPDEHLSDYLFARRSMFAGEGGIQTSGILAPRSLFLAVPFDPALSRHQDTDWLLRAWAAGATLRFCDVPLTVWHAEERRDSIAAQHQRAWELSYAWIRERRSLVTPRAYAAFLLIRGGDLTANAGSLRGAATVLREAVRHGRPDSAALAIFAAKWAVPRAARRWLRARLSGLRGGR